MDAGLALRSPSGTAAVTALGSSDDELGQVLALLRAAGIDEPERLSVAAGDRRLLELHRLLTGRDVEVAVTCGSCGTVNSALVSRETVPEEAPRSVPLGTGGGVRAPIYADLVALPRDPTDAVDELLRRCTVATPSEAPRPEALELVDDSLTGPILLECVECGESLEAAVDVELLALAGLQRHALAVEHEVHLLARAYGWSLDAIEALPDERRRRLARFVGDEG
jgi:hypothetical protein